MDLGIAGKVALVLGASGGLGGGAARALAAEGVTVVAAGRNELALAETVASIRAAGGRASAVRLDLSELDSIAGVVAEIESNVGPIDILVNVSGGRPRARRTGSRWTPGGHSSRQWSSRSLP